MTATPRTSRLPELIGRRHLAFHQVPHGAEPVAEHRRLLVLLRARGRAHLGLELILQAAVPPRQERDDLVDQAPVVLLADVADARRQAPLDVVIQARNPGRPAGSGPSQGRLGKIRPISESVSRTLDALLNGPKYSRSRRAAPGEVDARVVLVKADRDVRIALVVAQLDVERRPVALDQVGLEDQRLGLGRGHDRLETGDPGDHVVDLRMLSRSRGHRIGRVRVSVRGQRGLEVAEHAPPERLRLADVQHAVVGIAVDVHAGGSGTAPSCSRRRVISAIVI